MRLLVSLCVLVSAGCCAGPSYAVLAHNPRLEIQDRDRFAVLATVLHDERAWGFGAPASPLQERVDAYRPRPAAARDELRPPEDAPADVAAALDTAQEVLEELGYRMAGDDEALGFVLSVSLSWLDDGSLARVAIQLGAEVDEAFEPHQVSLAATLPAGGCEVTVVELVRDLVSFLPPHGETRE